MALHSNRQSRQNDLLSKLTRPGGGEPTSFGRRLRSSLSTEESVENFKKAVLEDFGKTPAEFFTPVWSADSAVEAPDVLIGVWLGKPHPRYPRAALYLAIWETGERGIALARTEYTRETPMPWIAIWKELDPSLESIGFVDVFDLEPQE